MKPGNTYDGPYSDDQIEEIREILKDWRGEQRDWNELPIEFICEEVLPLEKWRICFVHSYVWQLTWDERVDADNDASIRKLCDMTRGRLIPSMFPLLEPRGPMTDFSAMVWILHRRSKKSPSENHWSMLFMPLEVGCDSKAEGSKSIIEHNFYHYDSLAGSPGNNLKKAQKCAQLIGSCMLWNQKSSKQHRVVVQSVSGVIPTQPPYQRSCGFRSCLSTYLVAYHFFSTSSVLVDSLDFKNRAKLASQHLIHTYTSRLNSWRQDSKNIHDLGKEEANMNLIIPTTSYYYTTTDISPTFDTFLYSLESASHVAWISPLKLLINWNHTYKRVDIYALKQDYGEQQFLYIQQITGGARRENVIVSIHIMEIPQHKQRWYHSTTLWHFRLAEYLVRGSDRRLLLSTEDATDLVTNFCTNNNIARYSHFRFMYVHIPGFPYQTYCSVIDTKQPPIFSTILVVSNHSTVTVSRGLLRTLWDTERQQVITHKDDMSFIRGIDYAPIVKAILQIRLSHTAHSKLAMAAENYTRTFYDEDHNPDGMDSPIFFSTEWAVLMIHYLIYVKCASMEIPMEKQSRTKLPILTPVATAHDVVDLCHEDSNEMFM